MEISLNPYQRRSLVIVLRTFEQNLRNTLTWLDGKEEKGILYYKFLRSFPESQKSIIKDKIQVALNLIQELAQKTGIDQRVEDVAGSIRSELSISWADLTDLQARKLQRYGKTDPGLSQSLDPSIQELARIAFDISTIFNQSLPAGLKSDPPIKDKNQNFQE